ncbi:MAG: uracil-DNA glycosylase [Gemmataceae bacterium]|nr:uracil-DNA glycosylase [Gemmataceae bacterium]
MPDLFETEPCPLPALPPSWLAALADEFRKPYWAELQAFIAKERDGFTIFPPDEEVFTAFHLTPYESVRVLILGQDPYPGEGQAHGLSFSVKPGIKIPASLRNIYQELKDDLEIEPAKIGHLANWAKQGVLMLNAVLTVRAGEANSHKGQGWELFTDAVIRAVSAKPEPVVFVLWGGYAQKKVKLIDASRHATVQSAHPSPLSAHTGFIGSKPFSKMNAALLQRGFDEIDWRVDNRLRASKD